MNKRFIVINEYIRYARDWIKSTNVKKNKTRQNQTNTASAARKLSSSVAIIIMVDICQALTLCQALF